MTAEWQVISGGITAPRGFRATGIAAGLKPSGAPDLTLIVSDVAAVAAGVFTTNQVKAACVTYGQAVIAQQQPVRAIVCNAGQANACTGSQGDVDNQELARLVAEQLGIPAEQVLTASTGVIGRRLAMDKLQQAMPHLVESLSVEGAAQAARAILTTDLVEKTITLQAEIAGIPVRLAGIAKGSGMIHPNLATMLAFITCDASVSPALWQNMLATAADLSFNQITVDGDTSTNDMLLALANGQSGSPLIQADTAEAEQLQTMLNAACIHLAKAIARDGEGANKLLEIRVRGAASAAAARQIARVIASSPLVKSAAFGCDPNWGRVVAAAGRAGVTFDARLIDLWLGDFQMMQAGMPLPFDRQAASDYLKGDPVTFLVDLHQGSGEGIAWGCDLSYDYVKINAEYTT
ncbi:MAG: bifunctional glutamate N-acetyltransferase/amino-acid acetyltransferase ArgJ [Cyanobacteriota bacterium]|nr:bifunctional glutamate N-acetyltransferase/amino-acid acetyltransferase ArgJ [Cyanobacteriota bacterium]